MARQNRIPEWFEEAAVLRSQGLSVRAITRELRARGYTTNHTSVWHAVTPAGREEARRRQTPEFMKAAKAYNHARYHALKRMENGD